MDNKPFKTIAGIVAFIVGGLIARQAIDFIRREPDVSKHLAEKAWVQQKWGMSSYSFEAPWPLEPNEMHFASELARLIQSSSILGHEADGLLMQAICITYHDDVQLSLEGAADGALSNMKSMAGTLSTHDEKKETTILELPAYELSARIERERGDPLQYHGVIFGEGQNLYQLQLIYRADQPNGNAVWLKLLESIRRVSG